MDTSNKIEQDLYSYYQTAPSQQKPEQTPVDDAEKSVQKEVIKGSVGYQKELLSLASNSQTELSNRETAKKQLKSGYLDITI